MTEMSSQSTIKEVEHPLATIWVAHECKEDVSYFYGGTRLIDHAISDVDAKTALLRLMSDESGFKNRLINCAIASAALDGLEASLPPGFLQSRVAGARCIIRPRTKELEDSLLDPLHSRNRETTVSVLRCIGTTLNEHTPRVRLTPDFGRYAGMADLLYEFTPNVLGIRCDLGGCGGKSSYSTTGVLAGFKVVGQRLAANTPITCIGSAGAMGAGVLDYFLKEAAADLAVCDLVYDQPDGVAPPAHVRHLPARAGCFTRECMTRGGAIIATTFGDELESSEWDALPSGSVLILAHNLALPRGTPGIALARALASRGILVIPGQALTLGGALTARLEWYWRQCTVPAAFNKDLAHEVVRRVVSCIVHEILAETHNSLTPYERLLHIVGADA